MDGRGCEGMHKNRVIDWGLRNDPYLQGINRKRNVKSAVDGEGIKGVLGHIGNTLGAV